MTSEITLKHEFVDHIPNELNAGTIYVSITFATVVHKCCCGCGNEVVTPLSPTDWKLIYDGQSITLNPSIGNWNFDCKSHYWIKRNRVIWAPQWSQEEIDAGRAYDTIAKDTYFSGFKPQSTQAILAKEKSKENFWRKLKRLLF
ncbi:MAG: hypothetical protein JRL30_20990 [Deltaproteobacteria bacterium]|nr:hypothetical protein [Deltaproteobacteria bacterium]